MNKRNNSQILGIVLIIFGAFFFISMITCIGMIGGSLNDKTEIETKSKTYKENKSDDKKKIAEDKTKNNRSADIETATKTPEKTKKSTIKPTPVKTLKTINTFDAQLNILKEEFKGVAEIKVKNNKKNIEIIPIDKTFMVEAMYAYNGDQKYLKDWNQLRNNLKKVSTNFNDDQLILNLVNNLNTENYILMICDGVVLYDFINDKG